MATPPNSSGIFLSSSPTRYSSNASEEVDVLLTQARMVDSLRPTTEIFVTTQHDAFFKTFERRINLIRSRSQAFQDAHVTVFDKVLLELTQHGQTLYHAAAIEYFCEEFLGIPSNISSEQETATLSDAVVHPVPFVPAMTPPGTHRDSISTDAPSQNPLPRKSSSSSPKKSLFDHELDPRSDFLAKLARAVGPAAARLWSVYDQAKEEFLAITDPDSTEKLATARFLRDTAENTLQYLKDKAVDPQLLEEIEVTFDLAKLTATGLCGGKKRKFDSMTPVGLAERNLAARNNRNDTPNAELPYRGRDRNSRTFKEPVRGEFAGHTRALIQRRRLTPPRNMVQGGQKNAGMELFPTDQYARRKRKNQTPRPQPGRGHSNIPFGYSRPVDSYQPASQ